MSEEEDGRRLSNNCHRLLLYDAMLAWYAVRCGRVSVRPFVCLSQAGIVLKLLNVIV